MEGLILRSLNQVNAPNSGHVHLMVDVAGKNFMRVEFSVKEIADFAIDFQEVLSALIIDGKYPGKGFVCSKDGVVLRILLDEPVGERMLNRMDVLFLMFSHGLHDEIGKNYAKVNVGVWY